MTEQEPAPTDLLPCPFCGSIDLKIVGVAAEDDPDFEYARAVMCMVCYARGRHNYPIGWAESDRAASEAWNEREPRPDSSSISTEHLSVTELAYQHKNLAEYLRQVEIELRDTKRALDIIVQNYLEGNPTDWALGVARRERIGITSRPENGQ
jgi:Lar family restriction alleviation protein